MTRYRILIVLLTLTGFYAGFAGGGRAWPVAAVVAAIALLLGYFAARPESYVPDHPVYEAAVLDQGRKWARRATLLGALLAGLILMLGLAAPFLPGGVSRSLQVFVMDILPTLMLLLLFGGFAAWSLAVAWKHKQQAVPDAASASANPRYRILVLLLLAVSLACGVFQGASAYGLSGYAAAAMPLFCAMVALAILTAWPEFHNPGLPGFGAGGAERVRRRMRLATLYGVGAAVLGLGLVMTHGAMGKDPALGGSFSIAVSMLAGLGMFLFLGGAVGWCGALFLKTR